MSLHFSSDIVECNKLGSIHNIAQKRLKAQVEMNSAGNGGILDGSLQMLHAHILFAAPLSASHMAELGTDQDVHIEDWRNRPLQRYLYAAIQECHAEKGYPIKEACKLLHVARSAYHCYSTRRVQHSLGVLTPFEKQKHILYLFA